MAHEVSDYLETLSEPTRGRIAADVTQAGLGSTKGAVHLREGEVLPPGLLARLVERRIAQIDETR